MRNKNDEKLNSESAPKTSAAHIAANRANAQKSTGPRTAHGRFISSANAFKHGILSRETVVQSCHLQENDAEFVALHQRLWEDLEPVGVLEEMLVDQIITAHWRSRRVLKAEAGEIAWNVDQGTSDRKHSREDIGSFIDLWAQSRDPNVTMSQSFRGNRLMEMQMLKVVASVEQNGELTDGTIRMTYFQGRPSSLAAALDDFRASIQSNPESLDPDALRARQKEQTLAMVNERLLYITICRKKYEQLETRMETALQDAATLPAPDILDKIMRYETRLKRQIFRAMNQLEHLQYQRRGEKPPPRAPQYPDSDF